MNQHYGSAKYTSNWSIQNRNRIEQRFNIQQLQFKYGKKIWMSRTSIFIFKMSFTSSVERRNNLVDIMGRSYNQATALAREKKAMMRKTNRVFFNWVGKLPFLWHDHFRMICFHILNGSFKSYLNCTGEREWGANASLLCEGLRKLKNGNGIQSK